MRETAPAEEASRGIKGVIAVMSGKGGAGKSTITSLLASALRRRDLRVGVLDGDFTSPSILELFGSEPQLSINARGEVEPLASKCGVKIMSIAMFLENASESVMWYGTMVSSAIKQFYSQIDWGPLDYLLVDVATGTADVPITVLQSLPLDGVVVVYTPGRLAQLAQQRCVQVVRQLGGRLVGLVENLSYLQAPDGERYEIFGPSQASSLAHAAGTILLGQLPIDSRLTALCDAGRVEEYDPPTQEMLADNFLAALHSVSRGSLPEQQYGADRERTKNADAAF
jgi:Mrp family chromosome partitioning ATPase